MRRVRGACAYGWGKELKRESGDQRLPVGVLSKEHQHVAVRLEAELVHWVIDVSQLMQPFVDVIRRAVDLDRWQSACHLVGRRK